MQQTLEELRAEKQKILQLEPYAGGNIEKSGDVVFFMKRPGVDAFVYDSGTLVKRMGFGEKKLATIKRTFREGVATVIAQGYRPYPYFRPGFREAYEAEHNNAKEKIKKLGEFFPRYEKLNKKDIQSARETYQRNILQAPILQQPIIYRQAPINRQQISRVPQIQNMEERYSNLFRAIDEANMEITRTGKQTQIQRQRAFTLLEPKQFSSWAHGLYSNVRQRDYELKNVKNPFAEAEKKAILAAKIKAKEKEKAKTSKIKAGEDNE